MLLLHGESGARTGKEKVTEPQQMHFRFEAGTMRFKVNNPELAIIPYMFI